MNRLLIALAIIIASSFRSNAQCACSIPFVAASQATGNATGVLIPKPVGVAAGHLMIAAIHVGWCNSGSAITPPAGWTLINSTSNTGSGCGAANTTIQMATFYKIAGMAEPLSYSFSAVSNQFYVGGIAAYSGANTVTPIHVSSNNGAQSSCTNIVASGVTTSLSCARLISVFFCSVNSSMTNILPQGSLTERFDVGTTGNHPWGNENVELSDELINIAGATGSRTAALSGCSGTGWVTGAQLIAITSSNVPGSPTISVNSGSICSGKSFTMVPTGASTYTFQGGSAVVSPTTNSTYTVVGTGTNGCTSNVVTSTVTVNPNPTITVNSGSICSGSNFTMVPSGASTYTYQGGSAVVSPTINASYTVVGTSSLGCLSNTATSNVTVSPAPTVTAVSSASFLCPGQTANLTASGANSYTWNTTATTSMIIVSPTVTTSYTVTGTGANGCTGSAVITQSASTCSGITLIGNTETIDMNIYPNPNNGSFTIDVPLRSSVVITDMLGKLIYDKKVEKGKSNINLGNLTNGVYLLKIESDGRSKTIKFVKE